ncbi:hypothetical protein NDU88_011641 [Pleurodeles waltl]|uniref:Uncharacterized protein n=1 Tax=Pleurodeles waltl TaxID=8319 RepID=A0AAV7S1T6_PLEWA|nr:hypothetical protein NDU88_011641 [Pleurodeles waltl]
MRCTDSNQDPASITLALLLECRRFVQSLMHQHSQYKENVQGIHILRNHQFRTDAGFMYMKMAVPYTMVTTISCDAQVEKAFCLPSVVRIPKMVTTMRM